MGAVLVGALVDLDAHDAFLFELICANVCSDSQRTSTQWHPLPSCFGIDGSAFQVSPCCGCTVHGVDTQLLGFQRMDKPAIGKRQDRLALELLECSGGSTARWDIGWWEALRRAENGDECPVCGQGTVEHVEGEIRCTGMCGIVAREMKEIDPS